MTTTGIAWTNSVWNPVVGCSHAQQRGCDHCYAARFASRGLRPEHRGLAVGGKWTGEVRFLPERLGLPLRWRKPRRVFVNSMSDLFHDAVTNEQIAAIFGVMSAAEQHTFQLLTKRPERARRWFDWVSAVARLSGATEPQVVYEMARRAGVEDLGLCNVLRWPVENVHLGVSCSTQAEVDRLVPELLACPAAVRWVSLEPLLEQVEIRRFLPCGCCPRSAQTPALDWVVVGSESGPGRRQMDSDWVRLIRACCIAAGTPLFYKQQVIDGKLVSLPALDGKTWAQFPEARP